MKTLKPLPLILLAGASTVVAASVWLALTHRSAPIPPPPLALAPLPPHTPLPLKPIPTPVAVSPAPTPQPVFVSQSTVLQQPPSVFDLELLSGNDAPRRKISLRGVALAKDGKVLTLASFFDGQTSVLSASIAGRPDRCDGWLAREATSPWIILKLEGQDRRPGQVVAASYLKLTAGVVLAIPTPTAEAPQNAQTVLTIASPDGNPIQPQDELFWITGPAQVLSLGSPVLDSFGHLVGLVDQLGTEATVARVRKVSAPLPVMDRAVDQPHPLDWALMVPPAITVDFNPFTDSTITPQTIQRLTELSGDSLTHALDQLLQNHPSSALAWSQASLGYARAGKPDYAIASAHMLTQVAPAQWQSWYLYGRQLEAHQQFGQAADAYQQASEANAPQQVIGIPLAASLYKSGNTGLGMENLKNLLNLDPDNDQAWVALGDMQRSQGLLPEATRTYTHLLMLNPTSIPNWAVLATIYDRLQNPQGSIECYLQLTLLKPEDPDIWYNLGLALLKAKRPDDAHTCFEKTVLLRPNDTGAQAILAQVDASPVHARQLLEKLRGDLGALPANDLVDFSPIRAVPLEGKWENHNLRLVYRYGDVRFRDRIDHAETATPTPDSIPVLAAHSAYLSLTVAPVQDAPPVSLHRFDLGLSIPGYALYICYVDSNASPVAGKPSPPSQAERDFYRTIERDLSQLNARLSSN